MNGSRKYHKSYIIDGTSSSDGFIRYHLGMNI